MFKLWFWPFCLIERHHWLLQGDIQEDYGHPELHTYYYQCQRCGRKLRELVRQL